MTVVVTAANAWGSATATAAPTAPVAAAPPVNTSVPVIQSPSPVIQQGVTLTVGGYAWDSTPDTTLQPLVGALRRRRAAGRSAAPPAPSTRCSPRTSARRSSRSAPPRTSTHRSPPAPPRPRWRPSMAGPRWKTLPLISNSTGRVGDTVTATPGTWSGPAVTADVTEMMRCTNVCVPRGTANARTYTIADSDLGAILRVRETASNVGGETVVWSARYVGPVISAQAAAAVLNAGETALRNAQGSTLALATAVRAPASRAPARRSRPGGAEGHAAPRRPRSRASSSPGPARPRSPRAPRRRRAAPRSRCASRPRCASPRRRPARCASW